PGRGAGHHGAMAADHPPVPPDWRADLRTLAAAETVAFGPVGFAAATLPETAAYARLSDLLGARDAARDELGTELRRLLREASPAGRVYAAELLARLEPAAASDAWRALADDDAAVTTFSGCVMDTTTLRAYAAGRR
ncbi:MAG TPA: hypothetical protein VNV66_01500, partial [Pilimelia sp.]|nr:hypothetical protein [Pilimelia sp.]